MRETISDLHLSKVLLSSNRFTDLSIDRVLDQPGYVKFSRDEGFSEQT